MINLAFITDNSYLIPTTIVLRTLAKSLHVEANVYVISREKINRDWVEEIKKELPINIGVKIIEAGELISDLSAEHLYLPTTSLLKFYLPQILCDIDKVLYLDGDLLIRDSIESLYSIDLEDNYLAAVKDMLVCDDKQHLLDIGVTDYYNSGVMLLNLRQMREDSLTKKLLDAKRNDTINMFMDQDAFNTVTFNRTKYLDVKYNYIAEMDSIHSEEEIRAFYNVKDQINPVIIHLAGLYKPWTRIESNYYEEWFSNLKNAEEMSWCFKRYDKYYQKKIEELATDFNNKIEELTTDFNNKLELDRSYREKLTEEGKSIQLLVDDVRLSIQESYKKTSLSKGKKVYKNRLKNLIKSKIVELIEFEFGELIMQQSDINLQLMRIIEKENLTLEHISHTIEEVCNSHE